MSFIIAVHVKEGIVLASDSRTTYSQTSEENGKVVHRIGTHTTDTTYKTFLCPNQAGISTCGDASLSGVPITGFIEAFIRERVTPATDVAEMPRLLIDYFQDMPAVPDTSFMVAGYRPEKDAREQRVYKLNVRKKSVTEINTAAQGASWDGETQTLSKIIQNTYMRGADGAEIPLGKTMVSWALFTLQDAIDFALYAVDVTIKTMHYSDAVETVGGPIDVLVIKPDGAFWIRHKELHA